MEVDEEAELAKALEASKQALVEEERKRWELVLVDAAREREEAVAAQQPAVLEQPLEWWQVPMDVDLPPAPPLPEGLIGMRWTFTDDVYEVECAAPPGGGPGAAAHAAGRRFIKNSPCCLVFSPAFRIHSK